MHEEFIGAGVANLFIERMKLEGWLPIKCLKQAWQVVKLESAMKTKVVEFFFMKMNGEVRQAFGTLLQSHIDYTPNGTGHAASRDCIRYWDEAKGAWRQFKAYNFLRVA